MRYRVIRNPIYAVLQQGSLIVAVATTGYAITG